MPTYPKYIDLNIGSSALTHMSIEDALKEIISNAFDEHILSNITRNVKIYQDTNNKWCIRDYGRGITTSSFKFNINTDKELNNETIGFFGYGLKDSIAIMHTLDIKFKIYTNRYIFTPMLKERHDMPEEKTIHIEIIRNTTHEIKKGTKFIFDNLEDINIEKAKDMFIKYVNPKILIELDDYQLFRLDSYQSIFINGVEVYKNTGYHFSYNIKSSDNIRKCFNRDRKQLDLLSLKPHIQSILKKVNMFNTDIIKSKTTKIANTINNRLNKTSDSDDDTNSDNNDDNNKSVDNIRELFNIIKDILKMNTLEFLQEFNQIDILRNIIRQINDLNEYVFVGIKEKSKVKKDIKEKIKNNNRDIFIIGEAVRKKFFGNVKNKNIIDLYYNATFYNNDDTKHIETLANYIDKETDKEIIDIKEHIKSILKPVEKIFTLPDDLKNKLLNITVIDIEKNDTDEDDEYEDAIDNIDDIDDEYEEDNKNKLDIYGYDFDDEVLKITKKYTTYKKTKELFAIIFRYIVNNIDDTEFHRFYDDQTKGSWKWW